MKKAKKLVALIMSAFMVCAVPTVVTGCNKDDDGTKNSQTENAVKLKDGTDISVKVGESKTVTVSEYVTANGNAVTVNSSNTAVAEATLDNGVVTVLGKTVGSTNVKITCGGVEITFPVSVSAAVSQKPAPVFEDLTASYEIDKDDPVEVTLAPKSGGDGFTFTYSLANSLIQGASITDDKLTFSTDTEGDVEISVNVVCTDSENPQTVYDDITFKVKISVTKYEGPVYYTVVIDGDSQQVASGATVKLPDKPKQEIAEGKQFKGWQVGQDVKSGGSTIVVTGPLVITAVIEDAPQTDPEKVKDGEAVAFLLSESSHTIAVADYITTHGNAVSVSSSEETVAGVSESGGVIEITAVAAGKTVVTLTCKTIVLTFNVTVKNAVPTFENGALGIDKFVSSEKTYEIEPNGADTYSYEYSVTGAPAGDTATVTDGVLSYTAANVGTVTLTVNVTATDEATDEVETTSFTVTVTVIDSTANRIANGSFDSWEGNVPTGWTVTEGYGSEQTASTYWGTAEFDNIGSYFGETDEDKTGTLQSPQFIVGNSGWVTFQLGSGHTDAAIWVEIVNAKDDSTIAKFRNFNWSDPANALRLIPYKVNLSDYMGESVYIKVVDNQAAGDMGFRTFYADEFNSWYDSEPTTVKADNGSTLAFVNLGAPVFRNVNQSLDLKDENQIEVTLPEMLYGMSADCTYSTDAAGATISGNKLTYGVTDGGVYEITVTGTTKYGSSTFKVVISAFNSLYSIENGGFETGDLSGWTVLSGNVNLSGGTSNEAHHDWAEHMPYNKSGNYFCKNAGVAEGEEWELKSTVFTLAGNGHVSFKMGSMNAVIKVYLEDGTQIYQYTCHSYNPNDSLFPHFEDGGNWCTMLTHYADLSAYKGQSLYITIGNNGSKADGWKFAHFDDIVTYYEESEDLSAKKDNVLLTCTNGNKTHEEGETLAVNWIKAENEYNG